MNAAYILVGASALTFAAARIAKAYLRREDVRLEGLRASYDIFCENAQKIINYPEEIPTSVLNDIEYFSEMISDPRRSRNVSAQMARWPRRTKWKLPQAPKGSEPLNQFLTDHPDFAVAYISIVVFGVIAAAFRDRWLGLFVYKAVTHYASHLHNIGAINSKVSEMAADMLTRVERQAHLVAA